MGRRTRKRKLKQFIRILIPVAALVAVAGIAVTIGLLASRSGDADPKPNPGSQGSYTVDTEATSSVSGTHSTDLPPEASSETVSETVSETKPPSTDVSEAEDTPKDTEQYQISTIIPPPNDGTTKKIAFTFDDGPHRSNTRIIGDEFKKYGGQCTYFVVGNRVYGPQAEAMAYVASLGHEIAIHAWSHEYYFNKCSSEVYQNEIIKTRQVIIETVGTAPVLMRPPGGSMTKERISQSDYSVILWNVDTEDWKYKTAGQGNINTIVNNVLNQVTDGDIILMHDLYDNTAEAVKILLPLLKDAGYEFVTVSELLGEHRAAGIRYYNAY